MAIIYIVAHGDKFEGFNPGMTGEGFTQVKALRPFLPKMPGDVVCGEGRRHRDVAQALGLSPTRYTAMVGGPASLGTAEGVEGRVVWIAEDFYVPHDATSGLYTTVADMGPSALAVLVSLRHNSVVCAGRPLLIALGHADVATSAAVFQVDVYVDVYSSVAEVVSIECIKSAGDAGVGDLEV